MSEREAWSLVQAANRLMAHRHQQFVLLDQTTMAVYTSEENVPMVVNIKHGSYYDQYIGRRGQEHDGYFGNPHPVGAPCPVCTGRPTHTRKQAIDQFRVDFYVQIDSDPEFKRRVEALRGKVLGCFCKPEACHGDVYVEWLNGGR